MGRSERSEPPCGLLELSLAPGPPSATGLIPGDDDMNEALEEVLLGRVGGAPRVLEGLVRGKVLARSGELEAALEISRQRL